MPDPNKTFPPDLLPGALGLTEGQVSLAAQAVQEAFSEKRFSAAAMIETLRMVVTEPDRSPIQVVLDELEDEYTLVAHGAALRALALGIRIGKGEVIPAPEGGDQ